LLGPYAFVSLSFITGMCSPTSIGSLTGASGTLSEVGHPRLQPPQICAGEGIVLMALHPVRG
jgi:hypothetical protein